jgi:cytochrome c-type biogenesis protein CcmH
MMILGLLLALGAGQGLSGPALDREARAIESMLIAPCCFSQQVSIHQSPAADEARQDIRARLASGQTRQEILDVYTAQYGKRILAEPPAEGFDRALYVLPPILLLASAALVIGLVRRFSRQTQAIAEPAGVAAPAAEYEQKLNDELRDLD